MLTKRIKDIFDKHNGILTLKQAVDHGLSKESLRRAYLRGDLAKLKGGIYLLDNSYSDELYTTQLRYPKGIYSHETAVMLHSLSTYSPFVYHKIGRASCRERVILSDVVVVVGKSVEWDSRIVCEAVRG